MREKNDVEVIIEGKKYTLCGYESAEYLQRIAAHINGKYNKFKEKSLYNGMSRELKNTLLSINLADDYFKAKEQADELLQDIEQKEKEIFDMKHEIITLKQQLDKNKDKL